ncbi:MAG: VanZ family protein [Clostridia bacterium]|nr:VanZ family protein [Clostridia bacterium]
MKKAPKIILTVLILCLLAFIWGNSCLPGEESDVLSLDVVSAIWGILPDGVTSEQANNIVRKIAHFSEFGLLGALLCLRFLRDPDVKLIPFSLAFSCAVIDETIQIFSGRGPSFIDVLIDSAGAACGVALILLIFRGKRGFAAGGTL